MAGPQPSIAAPAGWESGLGPASASLSPRCSLPTVARHLLLTQHWLKAEILSSLHLQGSVQGAAQEHVGVMVPRLSIHPSLHKPQGWSKVDRSLVLLQPFMMVKLEVPGRALSPAWGHPGDCALGRQCPGCGTMRSVSCFIFQADA